MTSNVIINKVTPPPANALKKGYTYMGVTGTFEGYGAKETIIYSKEKGNVDGFTIPNGCGISGGNLWWNSSSSASVVTKNDYNLGEYDELRVYCNIDSAYEYVDKSINISYYTSSSGATASKSLNSDRVYNTGDNYTYTTINLNKVTMTGKISISCSRGLKVFYWVLVKNNQ